MIMKLKEELGAFAQQMSENVPEEVLQTIGTEIGKLAESGIVENALKVGDKSPEFELKNSDGNSISLSGLVQNGPVIISFNRGSWCPFCNIEFKHLQHSIEAIKTAGANLVVISPQLPEKSQTLKSQNGFDFPILYDKGNELAKKFGIAFTLAEPLRPIHEEMDFPAHNGDESFELPIPATYVINEDKEVVFASINPNWMERAEPTEYIEAVKKVNIG